MNNIKIRLTVMNFLQFFVWGSWLTSLGVYLGRVLDFEGGEIAGIFATMGIAAIIMPALLGIVADRFVNAERLLGICHLVGGVIMFTLTEVTDHNTFFWLMLLYTMAYMPTLALSNSIAFYTLKDQKLDIVSMVGQPIKTNCIWQQAYPLHTDYMPLHYQNVFQINHLKSKASNHRWDWMPCICSKKKEWQYSSFSPCCWELLCK